MQRWYCRMSEREAWTAVEADSAAEAAERFAMHVKFGVLETLYIPVAVIPEPQESSGTGPEWYRVRVEPREPDCVPGPGHEWIRPHQVVGGFADDPGRRERPDGVVTREICRYCGWYRRTTADSVRYDHPNERSLTWIHRE